MYALATGPLINSLNSPVKQIWYADNPAAIGKIANLRSCWDELSAQGLSFDYYANASKTWLVVKERFRPQAETILADTVWDEDYIWRMTSPWCTIGDHRILFQVYIRESETMVTRAHHTFCYCHDTTARHVHNLCTVYMVSMVNGPASWKPYSSKASHLVYSVYNYWKSQLYTGQHAGPPPPHHCQAHFRFSTQACCATRMGFDSQWNSQCVRRILIYLECIWFS